MTQQPFKTAYYVALLLQLSVRSDSIAETKEEDDVEAQIGEKRKAEDEGEADCGKEVLESLNIAFRGWVESRQWLNVRQCVSSDPRYRSPSACSNRIASFLLAPLTCWLGHGHLAVGVVQVPVIRLD